MMRRSTSGTSRSLFSPCPYWIVVVMFHFDSGGRKAKKTTFYVRAVVTSLSTSYLCIAVQDFFLVFGVLWTSFFISRSCTLRTIFCYRKNTVLTLKKTAKFGKIFCSSRVGCMESSKPNSGWSVTKIVCHFVSSGRFYPQSTTSMPRHDDIIKKCLHHARIPNLFLTIQGVFLFRKILPAITSMFKFFGANG